MNDDDIADYLLTHPAFFEQHAELLGRIRLANPHGQRAVSLPERQIEMLREKNRQLERRLSELVRYGHENDSHSEKLDQWIARLLAEPRLDALQDNICSGLQEIFQVPRVAIRLWGSAAPGNNVGEDIRQYAASLSVPYCGANTGFAAASWLEETMTAGAGRWQRASGTADSDASPESGVRDASASSVASIALVPLRSPGSTNPASSTFGLLALGSDDPQRFQNDMGTDFLIRLSQLSSAALSRLPA